MWLRWEKEPVTVIHNPAGICQLNIEYTNHAGAENAVVSVYRAMTGRVRCDVGENEFDSQQQHVGVNSSASRVVTDAVWSRQAFYATCARSINRCTDRSVLTLTSHWLQLQRHRQVSPSLAFSSKSQPQTATNVMKTLVYQAGNMVDKWCAASLSFPPPHTSSRFQHHLSPSHEPKHSFTHRAASLFLLPVNVPVFFLFFFFFFSM